MTNNEIEKYKNEHSEILKKLDNDKKLKHEPFIAYLASAIKKLQILSVKVGARNYIGTDLDDIDNIINIEKETNEGKSYYINLENKVITYEHIHKEISDNITCKLQTEEMFNACISAEESSKLAKRSYKIAMWSCICAAIAAIAACISVIISLIPSIHKALIWHF